MVNDGTFRSDLYFRLAVLRAEIPPLRERPDDIPLLAQHFADQLARRTGGSFVVPDATIRTYQGQSWPGNARELRNAIARLLSLGEPTGAPPPRQRIDAPDEGATFEVDLGVPLAVGRDRVADAYERAYLEMALRETGHNVTQAAELAGVSRKFVQRAMKRLGLRGDE
jgi:DNA-binding NtrC family response regulator